MTSNTDTSFCLWAVVTMSEAINLWGKTRKSIELQMWKGRLEYRQSHGGIILITRASLIRLWGNPIISLEGENHA